MPAEAPRTLFSSPHPQESLRAYLCLQAALRSRGVDLNTTGRVLYCYHTTQQVAGIAFCICSPVLLFYLESCALPGTCLQLCFLNSLALPSIIRKKKKKSKTFSDLEFLRARSCPVLPSSGHIVTSWVMGSLIHTGLGWARLQGTSEAFLTCR